MLLIILENESHKVTPIVPGIIEKVLELNWHL